MDRIKSQLKYLTSILRFGIAQKPILWLSIVLAFATSGLDIMCMSLLLPLSLVAQNIPMTGFLSRHFPVEFLNAKFLLLAFLILMAMRMLVNLVNQGITIKAGKTLFAIICTKLFGQVITDLPLSDLNSKGIGFYSSLAGDESYRASATVINLSQFFNLACMTLTYFIAIAFFSFKAFLFIGIFLTACFLLMLSVFKKIHQIGIKQVEQSRISNLTFIDAMNNVKSIRCFSGEKFVLGNYSDQSFEYVKSLFKGEFYYVVLRFVPIILLLAFAAVYIKFSMGRNQGLDLAYLIVLFGYLSRFFPSLGQCLNTALKLISDSKSGKDVVRYLEAHDPHLFENKITSCENITSISVKSVSFAHDKKTILSDFSYQFKSRESYVLVGPSGAGKSTLLDLILKFYPTAAGEIRLNEHSIKDLSDTLIRKKITLMEQRVTIFSAPILMNITLGTKASLEQVRQACRLAKIDDFIETLPEKYNSVIQYMGANLSGGQKQRIALARAILRDPDVLILDESLSALDVDTKEAIFTDLKQLFKDKILISVSHDPWIIKNSSVVLDFGNLN